jgi:PAS domain S-box-containing protein
VSKPDRPDLEKLRRRAEQLLGGTVALQPEDQGDVRSLVHELQVHQAELELQNEELFRTQRELETSRTRYRDLFEGAPVCYLILERDGLVREANSAAETLLALPRGRIVGQAAVRLAVPDDQVRLHELLEQAWSTRGRLAAEFQFQRKGGGPFAGRVECRPISQGDQELLLCTVVDVSPLRAALDDLRRGEERYRRLFESSRDGLLVLDARTRRVTAANGAACRLCGEAAEAVLGHEVEELFLPQFREQALQIVRAGRRAAGRPAAMRLALRGPGGTAVAVEAAATVVDTTESSMVLLSLRDLREQMRADEERQRLDAEVARLQRLQALGRMAGAVAHEMNNVLAVVMSVSSLAKDEWSTHPAGGDFGLILEAAQRGRDLAQRLLGFVRATPAKRGPQEPDRLLHEVAGLVRKLSNGLVLVVEDLDARDARVLGDGTQLHQALLNLGINSVDALGARGGRMVFRSRDVELAAHDLPAGATPGRYVRIEVEDSGPGFSPEAREHAFEPFFTTKPGKGTGLGLAAVWRTAQDHAGFVRVDASERTGARVVLHLPVAAPAEAPAEVRAPEPASAPAPATALALVVDDEPSLRASCRRLLERLGFGVLLAGSGGEAVDVVSARAAELSVVLLDLSMPEMSGLDAAERLRAIDPGLPIVLMSGYSEERVPPEFLAQPASDFLPKPFSLDQFAETVRRTARPVPRQGK